MDPDGAGREVKKIGRGAMARTQEVNALPGKDSMSCALIGAPLADHRQHPTAHTPPADPSSPPIPAVLRRAPRCALAGAGQSFALIDLIRFAIRRSPIPLGFESVPS